MYPAGAYRSLLGLVRAELLDLKPIRALQFPLEALEENKEAILSSVSNMLGSDPEYVRAISAGTGSLQSVRIRFESAEKCIGERLR